MRKTKLFNGLIMAVILLMAASLSAYSGGSGTEGAPYQIATTDDLIELSNTSGDWSAHFIQTTDITFAEDETQVDWDGVDGADGSGTSGFSPIGEENGPYFTGSYNGQNHTIANLYINRPNKDRVGLFGEIHSASIQRLGVINADITGKENVGVLAGYIYDGTQVESCFSSGAVTTSIDGNYSPLGGLIGAAAGSGDGAENTVNNSYSSANVTGNGTYVGGLFGIAGCIVNNCYATGNVTGDEIVGGFAGYFGGYAEITNCYSTGSVTGNSYVGGFGGDYCTTDGGPVITNSFWDVNMDGISGNSSGDDNFGATGKTTAQMKDYNTFTNAGWDFKGESTNGSDDIWNIGNARNDGYPYLDWQYPADPATLPVTLSSFTAMFANNSPVLQWETQSEDNNQGWNIYRSQDDLENATQINVELIPGAGTTSQITLYSYNDELDFAAQTEYFYWLESVDSFGQTELYGPVSLVIPEDQEDPETPDIPINYGLSNHPNPFNPATTINFAVRETGVCQIVVYDCKGRKIRTLFNETAQANTNYSLLWNGCDDNGNQVSSGVYFYKLRSADKNYTRKMLLLK